MPQFVPPPAPAPVAPPAAPQVPTPQTPPGTGGGNPPATRSTVDADGEVYHYPENTPMAHMAPQEQAEYWRRQARKHEANSKARHDYDALKAKADQFDQLVVANQTEHEKAVAEARRQGQTEALAQAAEQLVDQWVRSVAHQRNVPRESVDALLGGIKHTAFLNAQGGVDTDKVAAFVNAAAPPPVQAPAAPAGSPGQVPPVPAPGPAAPAAGVVPAWTAPAGSPDFGQGQPGQARASGLAAGREFAKQRFNTNAANTAQQ